MTVLLNGLTTIFVNLLLSADNGLVVAAMLRSIAPQMRTRVLATAAVFDIAFRTLATLFAAELLQVQVIKVAGGIAMLYIATRLFVTTSQPTGDERKIESFWKGVAAVVSADFIMSTDNVLAIAGVAQSRVMLFLALAVSIPIVLSASRILTALIERHNLLLYTGAAILGNIGAEMIIANKFVSHALETHVTWSRWAGLAGAAGVLSIGRMLSRRNRAVLQERALGVTHDARHPKL